MLKNLIIKIDKKIYKAERGFIIFCVLLMLFLSFLQVLLRFFLNSGISWLDIFLRYTVMISSLFAASIVSYHNQHFKIEILEKIIKSEKLKKNFNIFSLLISFIATLFILIAVIKYLPVEFELKEVISEFKSLKLKPHHMILFLPLIFFNMLFHSISNFLRERK
ncbi:MAG: TRAP transporter small permease [Elusimicrobiota bacterium]